MSTPRRPPVRPTPTSARAKLVRRGRVAKSLNEFAEREIHRSGVVVLTVVVLVLAVVNLFGPVQTWFEQQIRIASLTNDVSVAKAELAKAQADLNRWSDKAYIETQARQRLMYVYPGDISFLIVNDVTAKAAKTTEVLSTVQTTNINWVDAFMTSYGFAATVGPSDTIKENDQ